ncbi:MAG: hypothetical protein ABSB76_04520 [Streptosporangiaceae bacterium]|jgi:hypothetical protein
MEQRDQADDLLAGLVARPEDGTDPTAGLDAIGLLLAESVIGAQAGPEEMQTAAVQDLARSLTATTPRPRLVSVVLDARQALGQMPRGAAPERIAQECARAYAERLRSAG